MACEPAVKMLPGPENRPHGRGCDVGGSAEVAGFYAPSSTSRPRLESSPFFTLHLMARTAAAPKDPATYELALAELDRLVEQMESGQLPLDQLLDGYRRGADLRAFCRGRLQAVEAQVKVLEDGQLKPWVET